MAGEKQFPQLLAVKIGAEAYADFIRNAERCGAGKESVVRDLVRAFNDLCRDDVRATLPLRLVSPAYRIIAGHVFDATPRPYPTHGDAEERAVAEASAINDVTAMLVASGPVAGIGTAAPHLATSRGKPRAARPAGSPLPTAQKTAHVRPA